MSTGGGLQGAHVRTGEWAVEHDVYANRLGLDGQLWTPDYILARFLRECLDAWAVGLKRREEWFGRPLEAGPEEIREPP